MFSSFHFYGGSQGPCALSYNWSISNRMLKVINKKKCSGKLPKSFKVDNHEISNPIEIADQCCDYFTNVDPSLARKIPSSTLCFRSFLSGNYPNSIFFGPLTQQEILEIGSSLPSGTAAGSVVGLGEAKSYC